jgi:hypothetical protein
MPFESAIGKRLERRLSNPKSLSYPAIEAIIGGLAAPHLGATQGWMGG